MSTVRELSFQICEAVQTWKAFRGVLNSGTITLQTRGYRTLRDPFETHQAGSGRVRQGLQEAVNGALANVIATNPVFPPGARVKGMAFYRKYLWGPSRSSRFKPRVITEPCPWCYYVPVTLGLNVGTHAP